ncbi:hypothetical protein PROFUN_08079 [Planoprotostelium fungivorum]|uniref:Uncharacterized protein n=1 Tax=Planoprotostelium fungivorum TaxID=1890364 RepID=A0A2P6NKF1_9EUKA|nr:hypothetical protein PROFUN_08079 [Planoprotostelium fungivorum]
MDVEVDKGAVQCIGYNRKRKCQCRNAALKEYIGPAPQYCAEHIELDPNSLYQKCMSPYHKNPEDRRRCKEDIVGVTHGLRNSQKTRVAKNTSFSRVVLASSTRTEAHRDMIKKRKLEAPCFLCTVSYRDLN